MSSMEDKLNRHFGETDDSITGKLDRIENEKAEVDKGKVQVAMNVAVDKTPEHSSQVLNFARSNKLDPKFVERNKDLLFKEAKKKVDLNGLQKTSPVTTNHLQDPHKASVSQNEIPALSNMEQRLNKLASNKVRKTNTKDFGDELLEGATSSYYSVSAGLAAEEAMRGADTAADIAANVRKQREYEALQPKYIDAQNKEFQKESGEFIQSFRKFKKDFSDKSFSTIADEGYDTAGELFDIVSQARRNWKGMMYGSAKSAATFIPAGIGGLVGAGIGGAASFVLPFAAPALIKTGAALGGVTGMTASEAGMDFLGELESMGIDTGDENQLRTALSNKALMDKLRMPSYRKGVGTSVFEVGSTIIGAKLFAGAFKSGSLLARGTKLVAGQAAGVIGEGTGEFAGQAFKHKGDMSKIPPEEIMAEMYYSILNPIAMLGGAVSISAKGVGVLAGKAGEFNENRKANAKTDKEAKVDPVQDAAEEEALAKERAKYAESPVVAFDEMGEQIDKSTQALNDAKELVGLADHLENVKDTQKADGLIAEFSNKVGEDSNVFFQEDDFDNFMADNELSADETIAKMSEETQQAYADHKTLGIDFAMPIGDFVENILTDKKMRSLINFTKVRENGMTLADAQIFRQSAPTIIQQIAKEGKATVAKKKAELSDDNKIKKSIEHKIGAAGFKMESKYLAEVYSSIINNSSKLLGETQADFYKKFNLDFHRDSAKKQSVSAIINRFKESKRAEIAKHLEGIPADIAARLLADNQISIASINKALKEGALRSDRVSRNVKIAKKKVEKFGTFKKAMDHDKLPNAELKEVADGMLESMTDQFIKEVEAGVKGSRKFPLVNGKHVLATSESTFPKDYRLLGSRSQKAFNAAVEKFRTTGKANAAYKNIVKRAKARLIEGYDTGEGLIGPNNVYRSTLGMVSLNEKREEVQIDFDLFEDMKNPRGMARILGRKFDVSIFAKGDAVTLLHETGHVWLEMTRVTVEEMNKLDSLDKVQEAYMEQVGAMLEYLGVESFDQIEREHHEKFAETAVAYFAEGKAPTEQLRKAFARFKTWVLGFFRDIQNTGIEISPEIERFMGALLASKQEVNQAQREFSSGNAFQQAMLLGMNDKDATKYIAAVLEANLAAEEQAVSEYAFKERKKQLAEQRKARDPIKKEVTAKYDADPRYKAIETLRSQGDEAKLSKESIVMEFGEEKLKELTGLYSAKGGLHHHIAADLFGFADGTDFVNSIAGLPKKQEAINQETEAILEATFPDILMDDRELEAIATEAVLSEQMAKVTRLEIEHLMRNNPREVKGLIKRIGKKLKSSKDIKAEAKANVSAMRVKNVTPFKFEQSVSSNAKRAADALADGRMDDVVRYKQKELMALEMYREAKKAKDYITKSARKFKKLAKVDSKKKDIDYINGARALLEKHKMGVVNAEKLTKDLEILQKYEPQKFNKIDAITKAADFKPISGKELSYGAFFDVAETVFSMDEIARSEMGIMHEGKMVDKEAVIGLLEGTMKRHIDGDIPTKITEGKSEYADDEMAVMGFIAGLKRVEGWADLMDLGDKINGAFTKYIFRPVSEAVDIFRVKKTEVMLEHKELADNYARDKGETVKGPIDATKELGFTFSNFNQLLGALLHIGNDSNKWKLLGGYEWGHLNEDGTLNSEKWDAFFKRMMDEKIITEADLTLIQGMWDIMESVKPDVQKAMKSMEGKYMEEIEAKSFEAFGKTWRGGYAPAKIDGYYNEDASIRAEKDAVLADSLDSSFVWPSTGKGATHTRVGNTDPLVLDARIFDGHLDWAMRYIHIQPAVQNVAKIVLDKGFRKSLAQVDKHAGKRILTPWLARTAQQRVEVAGKDDGSQLVNKAAKFLRTNAAMGIMVGSVTNAAQQLTGIAIAAIKVKPRHLRDGMVTWIKNPNALDRFVSNKSIMMKERTGSQMFHINSHIKGIMLNPTMFDNTKKWVREHGYFLQVFTQSIVDNITWIGAYNEAIEANHNDKNSIRIANSAVRETQGSFNPEDISAFEVGTAQANLFKMFYTYFNMKANLVGNEFAKTIRTQGLKEGAGRLLYVYTMGIMMPAVLAELITKAGAGKFDEDDDDSYLDDSLALFFGSQLKDITASFPYSSIGTTALNQFNDRWYDDDLKTSPALSQLADSIKVLGHIASAMDSEKEVNGMRATRDVMTAISLFSGFPIKPLYKPIKYMNHYNEGSANPTNPLDFARGFVTGKSGE